MEDEIKVDEEETTTPTPDSAGTDANPEGQTEVEATIEPDPTPATPLTLEDIAKIVNEAMSEMTERVMRYLAPSETAETEEDGPIFWD